MATEPQKDAIANIILDIFEGNPSLYEAFLVRGKLTTELNALQSEESAIRADYVTETDEFNVALNANQEAQAAKQQEIDDLTAA